MSALSQNDWIRVVDFTGVLLAADRADGAQVTRAQERIAKLAPILQLAGVLRSNTVIAELSLECTGFSSTEVRELVAALKCNSSIKTLYLLQLDVSGNAGEAVVDLLHQTDAGAVSNCRHASAIETFTLNLSENSSIDDFPCAALCTALKFNATLTSIDLGTCFKSDASADLVDALEHNQRIANLKIDAKVFQGSPWIASSIDRILRARFLASRVEVDATSEFFSIL
jgi:hypothetical protein